MGPIDKKQAMERGRGKDGLMMTSLESHAAQDALLQEPIEAARDDARSQQSAAVSPQARSTHGSRVGDATSGQSGRGSVANAERNAPVNIATGLGDYVDNAMGGEDASNEEDSNEPGQPHREKRRANQSGSSDKKEKDKKVPDQPVKVPERPVMPKPAFDLREHR
jgi:hypothetical protein